VGLVSEPAILGDGAERRIRVAYRSDHPPGPLRESISRRSQPKDLSKATADTSGVQSMCVRPCFQTELRLAAQIPRQQVRPVCGLLRFRLKISQKMPEGAMLVALCQTSKRVRVRDRAGHVALRMIGECQHQHVRASRIEAVQMTFPGLVQEHVARLHPVASRIARFDISTRQDDRGKPVRVNMSQELLSRWVPRESCRHRAGPDR
jgi:hypothetical protein